jgi:hypothetical protein
VAKIQQKVRQLVDADLTSRCSAMGGTIKDSNFDRECSSGDKDDCTYDGGTITSHFTCECHCLIQCRWLLLRMIKGPLSFSDCWPLLGRFLTIWHVIRNLVAQTPRD